MSNTTKISSQSTRVTGVLTYRFSLPENCVSFLVANQASANAIFDGALILVPGQSTSQSTPDPVASDLIGDYTLQSLDPLVQLDAVIQFQIRR